MTATVELTRFTDQQRDNLRWWTNATRAPKAAVVVEQRELPEAEAIGKVGTVTLFEGRASDGYKTDYERVKRWWVEVAYSDGHSTFRRGKRFSREAAARRWYNAVS